jgi:hypothetical protein
VVLGRQPSDEVFDHAEFSQNLEHLSEQGIRQKFFNTLVKQVPTVG